MRRRFITKKENEIKQIINFIDRDVDGDGINIETLIQVEGEPLTAGVYLCNGTYYYTIKLKFPPRMRKKFTNKKIWQILTIIKKRENI